MDLSAFLRDSLALWQVQGTVASRDEAIVVNAVGAEIAIARSADGPFRWVVTYNGRKRGCASILGVLGALRGARDVDRGAPLRIS